MIEHKTEINQSTTHIETDNGVKHQFDFGAKAYGVGFTSSIGIHDEDEKTNQWADIPLYRRKAANF